jgi:hypothetical protein
MCSLNANFYVYVHEDLHEIHLLNVKAKILQKLLSVQHLENTCLHGNCLSYILLLLVNPKKFHFIVVLHDFLGPTPKC